MSWVLRKAAFWLGAIMSNLCLNKVHSFWRNQRRSSSVRQYAIRSAKWLTSSFLTS